MRKDETKLMLIRGKQIFISGVHDLERRLIYIWASILYSLNRQWFSNYMCRLDIGAGDPDTLHDILNL